MTRFRALMVGDVMARAGRNAVRRVLPDFISEHRIDFVVLNGENVSGGTGITPEAARDLFARGGDVITSGNHIWRQREIRPYIDKTPALLRPFNFAPGQPGRGVGVFETQAGYDVGVLNLQGQIFMSFADNPFVAADEALKQLAGTRIILVDFHAEATSEKRALGFHLDGRVSAMVGTHTHVQTADAQLLEKGTGFITDLGMTGPHHSVIGMQREIIVDRFRTGLPASFKPATEGARFQGVTLEIDPTTGRCLSIERVDIPLTDTDAP